MDAGSARVKAGSTGTKGVTQLTGATFVSILLGLVLANALDIFFKNASHYEGIAPAMRAVTERGWFSAIVTSQLLILVFSLVRFYLGSSRYHEEVPETDGGVYRLLIDLIGAISVFVSFYITSVLIKNTNLFYVGFGLIHIVDLGWFCVALLFLDLKPQMETVAGWYIVFDILTVVVLIGFFALDTLWGPWPRFFPQWSALGICFVIGLCDLKKLWPFYAGRTGWTIS
ncbi:MAG: hypothetical protein QOH41_1986 [Blastocatellia bacterium]|jgi:hypothetical protein|nr:hypothetical protein [Blastocatellia bacterium]